MCFCFQRIEANGTFGPNDYYINSFTDLETLNSKEKCLEYIKQSNQPSLKNPDTANQDTVQPSLKNPDTVNQDTVEPSLKNPDTINGDTINGDTINGDTVGVQI